MPESLPLHLAGYKAFPNTRNTNSCAVATRGPQLRTAAAVSGTKEL